MNDFLNSNACTSARNPWPQEAFSTEKLIKTVEKIENDKKTLCRDWGLPYMEGPIEIRMTVEEWRLLVVYFAVGRAEVQSQASSMFMGYPVYVSNSIHDLWMRTTESLIKGNNVILFTGDSILFFNKATIMHSFKKEGMV